MAKKIVFGIIALFLLIAIPITFFVVKQQQDIRDKAAPATTLTFSPVQKTVKEGDTFSLDINIDTAENSVVTVKAHFSFDPTKLEALNLTNSAQFPNILASADTSEPGKASIVVSTTSISQPFQGTGTVAVVQFRALQTSTTPVSIQFESDTYAGGIGETTNVLIGKQPGSITITQNGTQNPTPTTTIVPTGTVTQGVTPTRTPTQNLTITPTPASSSAKLTLSSPLANGSTTQNPPTFSGNAPAGNAITTTLSPGSTTGAVTAASNGTWVFTPGADLEPGNYSVTITSTNSVSGASETLSSSFSLSSTTSTITATSTPTPNTVAEETVIPVTGGIETTFKVLGIAVFFMVSGFLLFSLSL